MKKYNDKITSDKLFSMYSEWAKQNTYRKKYQTKNKLIEHITQIKDLKVDRKNIVIGLYKKINNIIKDEDEQIEVSDDEQ